MTATFSNRMAAFLIDMVIHVAIWVFFFFNLHFNDYLSWLCASIYLLVRDGLHHGQSLGKLLMGLQVVRVSDKEPITIVESIKRNSILIVPILFRFLPFWGSLLLIVVFVYEGFLIYNQADRRRWGDQFAQTMVVKT